MQTALASSSAVPSDGDAAAARSAPARQPEIARILLVDDDAQVRGRQALAEYRMLRTEVDLVILDQSMPVLGGEDTFRALQQENPGIRVLFASGHFAPEVASGLLALGAAGFVQKPYTIAQMGQAVAAALRSGRLRHRTGLCLVARASPRTAVSGERRAL